MACLDGLEFGDYTVTEQTPTGYAANASETVTVSAVSECGDGNEAAVSFHNTPLTDIKVSVQSQVDGGTLTTIECWFGDIDGEPDISETVGTGDEEFKDLLPTDPDVTLTCQFTVDP